MAKYQNNPVDARLNEILDRVGASQLKPNQLMQEVQGSFPMAVVAAFTAQRPELLKLAKPEPMTAEQVGSMFKLLAVVIETNLALQQHSREVAVLVSTWMQAIQGMTKAAHRIEQFAHFREVGGTEEEG